MQILFCHMLLYTLIMLVAWFRFVYESRVTTAQSQNVFCILQHWVGKKKMMLAWNMCLGKVLCCFEHRFVIVMPGNLLICYTNSAVNEIVNYSVITLCYFWHSFVTFSPFFQRTRNFIMPWPNFRDKFYIVATSNCLYRVKRTGGAYAFL